MCIYINKAGNHAFGREKISTTNKKKIYYIQMNIKRKLQPKNTRNSIQKKSLQQLEWVSHCFYEDEYICVWCKRHQIENSVTLIPNKICRLETNLLVNSLYKESVEYSESHRSDYLAYCSLMRTIHCHMIKLMPQWECGRGEKIWVESQVKVQK